MAVAREVRSVILVSERSLRELVEDRKGEVKRNSLRLELIRQYQIRLPQQRLVCRDFVFGDIQLALIAHDGIQHCAKSAYPSSLVKYDPVSLTPKHAPLGPRAGLELQIPCNAAHLLHGLGRRNVTREQYVVGVEPGLLEALVEFGDLGGGGFGAADLVVGSVVAWVGGQVSEEVWEC
jgi:hypothetical protein